MHFQSIEIKKKKKIFSKETICSNEGSKGTIYYKRTNAI